MEQHFVEPCRRSWKVKFEGDYIASFTNQVEAIRWAAERTHNAKARFEKARVLVRVGHGTFQLAWTNGPSQQALGPTCVGYSWKRKATGSEKEPLDLHHHACGRAADDWDLAPEFSG
jgi:hypothetical protein